METPEPVIVHHLFRPLLAELLNVLRSLSEAQWAAPTPCPAWSVHQLALHLLDVDVGQLSRERDGHRASMIEATGWDDLVSALNRKNEAWVNSAGEISPRLTSELLEITGEEVASHLSSLDPYSDGPEVSWAGPASTPMWLHIAREYTERWHHQQQIRQATGTKLLTGKEMFAPVLATFARAFPRTYEGVSASDGCTVKVAILGDAGTSWLLVFHDSAWTLYQDDILCSPNSEITIDQEDDWRLFTKSITTSEVLPRITFSGNTELAAKVLDTVAVIA